MMPVLANKQINVVPKDSMHVRSGEVVIACKLTSFFYTLLRDFVHPGDVEQIMKHHISNEPVTYSNGWLAKYAQDIASRLKMPSKKTTRKVILESPYAGNVEEHIKYARRALRDSVLKGEAPLASHLLYTQTGVLDDNNEEERMQGINAGLAWGDCADATVVYTDYGISRGMQYGIDRAHAENRLIEYREIGKNDAT